MEWGGSVAILHTLVTLFLVEPVMASADEHEPSNAGAADHTAQTAEHHALNVTGIKIFGLSELNHPDVEDVSSSKALGGGLFYERAIAHGMIDVEIGALWFRISHETVMPFELVFKKPFNISDRLTLYVGAGPAIDVIKTAHEKTRLVPTINAVSGLYAWFTPLFGVDAEMVFGHLFNPDQKDHQELFLAVGPAFRF